MAITLGANRYGKAEVRLVHVDRGSATHVLTDWNVSVALSGDLEATHLTGDNGGVLPTDTMKNTVYAFARSHDVTSPEAFGLLLARHFVATQPQIKSATITIRGYGWERLGPHSFQRSGDHTRLAEVFVRGDEAQVVAGIEGLVLMNTTDSEFHGFTKDRYTTLPETTDRILATEVNARWRYAAASADVASGPGDSAARTGDSAAGPADVAAGRADFADSAAGPADSAAGPADSADRSADAVGGPDDFAAVKDALIDAFRGCYSYSLQQTLFAMAKAALERCPRIAEMHLALPNKHHYLVDLSPFDLDNPGEVFIAGDRPYGLIEGTVARDDAPPALTEWHS